MASREQCQILKREAYDLFTSSNIALEAMWYMVGEGVERIKEKESNHRPGKK